MNLEQTVRTQRVRIEELEEELRQTKEINAIRPVLFPAQWGLRPSGHRLLAAFYRTPLLSLEQCFLAVARNLQSEGDNLVKVQVSHLRKQIEPLGMTIITRRGFGYEMPKESIAILHKSLEEVAG